MQLRYDEDFIEAAVFLCASGRRKGVASLQIARFHGERERLYRILDPDERNTAFFKLHLEWFREWGLERPLTAAVNAFPLLREKLAALAVRKAGGRNDEGAELYVNEAQQRTGLLALRVNRFMDVPALEDYLRHELTHLHDMLDPAFGYSPVLNLPGLNAAQRRLASERYRLLWDITIDGRLAARGHRPVGEREQHAAAFARGYCFWSAERQTETFDALWRNACPSHSALLGLIDDPRGLHNTHGPAPGATCPLCDFPTFAWAEHGLVSAGIRERVMADFPAWTPEHGLCNRCMETYQALTGASLAGTMEGLRA